MWKTSSDAIAPESSFPGKLKSEIGVVIKVAVEEKCLPAKPSIEELEYDLSHSESTQVWSVGVMVNPGHFKSRLIPSKEVSGTEVVITVCSMLINKEALQMLVDLHSGDKGGITSHKADQSRYRVRSKERVFPAGG